MSNSVYKIMKVFDCQWDPGMPEDVKKAFFDFAEWGHPTAHNDVYIKWTVERDYDQYDNPEDEQGQNLRLVDKWLMENGAQGRSELEKYEGETVLIKHWW